MYAPAAERTAAYDAAGYSLSRLLDPATTAAAHDVGIGEVLWSNRSTSPGAMPAASAISAVVGCQR